MMVHSLVVRMQAAAVAEHTTSRSLRDGRTTSSDVASLASMDVVMHVRCVNSIVFLLSIRHICEHSCTSAFKITTLVIQLHRLLAMTDI